MAGQTLTTTILINAKASGFAEVGNTLMELGAMANGVSQQLIAYQEYAKAYPALARGGRPAESSGWDTSIRDYSVGEYKTYSEGTLRQLLQDMKQMDNPVLRIQETLVSFYGFDSLAAAEAAQRR